MDPLSTEDQVASPKHSIEKAYQRITDLVKVAQKRTSDRVQFNVGEVPKAVMRHLVGQGLIDQAQEFLPRDRTITEAAQHPAGDEVRVRFVHAARGHAMMGCL